MSWTLCLITSMRNHMCGCAYVSGLKLVWFVEGRTVVGMAVTPDVVGARWVGSVLGVESYLRTSGKAL